MASVWFSPGFVERCCGLRAASPQSSAEDSRKGAQSKGRPVDDRIDLILQ